jgi:hypothetical protein
MSLAIFFISKDKSHAKEQELESQLSRTYVFGFEAFRQKLWGHEIMKSLGCTLTHSLGYHYCIYVFDEDMKQLKDEMLKIIDQVQIIVDETGIDEETIIYRAENVLDYIRVAELNGGNFGVTIG